MALDKALFRLPNLQQSNLNNFNKKRNILTDPGLKMNGSTASNSSLNFKILIVIAIKYNILYTSTAVFASIK